MAAPQFQPIHINRFLVGLKTQGRSPLVTPITVAGLQIIPRTDALIAGSNIELSNNQTLQRRPGFPNFCSQAFGVSEWPLNFYSWHKNDGSVTTLVDTQQKVYTFTSSTLAATFTKSTTAQTQFQSVGSTLYFVNGTDLKKSFNGAVTNMGIAAPAVGPALSFGAGALSPRLGYQYCYAFRNSTTGHVSTASTFSSNTLAFTSQNITISGSRSTDSQVDKVEIYRTSDGGSTMFFLAEVNNPPSGSWSFTDSNADSALNTLITANLNHIADPPPSGMSNLTFYQGRMWGAVGNLLYFAAGGDLLNGIPEEAWPPANVLTVPGTVTALMPTAAGLMVFTRDSITLILGGPDTLSYFPQIWMSNIGVLSQNSVSTDSETLFLYTTNRQLISIDQQSKEEVGFDVGDILLSTFDPSTTYIAAHRSGTDQGLFLSNGSTSVFRYSINNRAWSTVGTVVGGIGAIASLETSAGVYTLVAGRSTGSGNILARTLSSFVDGASSSYTASLTVGSLTLAIPGASFRTLYPLESVIVDRMPVGSEATVSVLLDDIAGTFTNIPNPVADPPELPASSGIISKRWYLSGASIPQFARHMQIQIAFPAEANKNEVLAVTVQPQTQ